MKKLILMVAVFGALSAAGQTRVSPHDTVRADDATVTYGRPYKKGRVIFGELEKYGRVWRVGADEATTISFKKDVKVAGQKLAAGTYTLFAIPNEKEWTIIFNSQPGQWGAYSYEKNKDKDVLKVNVPVSKLDNVVEQLTIRFDDKENMVIEWDQTRVMVPIDM